MGRFYQATKTNFLDYLDKFSSNTPDFAAVDSGLGAVEALPQDRPRASEILKGYEQEINTLASQLQRNPKALPTIKPQLDTLRSKLKDDYFYGELGAIRDRLNEYKGYEKQIQTTLKYYPTLQSKALELLRTQGVPDLSFDPASGEYGRIKVPTNIVKPLAPADIEKWQTTQKTNIKDTILSNTTAEEIAGNEFESILRIGEKVGVTKDQALAMLVGSIPREAIESEQMVADLQGRGTDESKIINDDGTPNLNTTWGKVIASTMEQIARENFKGTTTKLTDQAGLIKERGKEQRRNIKFKDDLDRKDDVEAATTFVEKMKSMWEGNPNAYDTSDPNTQIIRNDNWLAGYNINKKPIKGVFKVLGQEPMIEYVESEGKSFDRDAIKAARESGQPVYRDKDNKEFIIEQKIGRTPLDFESIENIDIPLKVKQQILREAISKGVMDKESRKVSVDPSQDLKAAQKAGNARKLVPGRTK